MAVRKPAIGEMKTIGIVQTNAPKIGYGSNKAGAGYLDKYTDLKTVRGKFETVNGYRVLGNGNVVPIKKYKYTFRFETAISNILDTQFRVIIHGKTYTVDSHDMYIAGRISFIELTLNQYNK